MEESDDPTKAVCSKILLNIVVLQNIALYRNAPKNCSTILLPSKVLYHRFLYNRALWLVRNIRFKVLHMLLNSYDGGEQ